jgi:hypothetical protein
VVIERAIQSFQGSLVSDTNMNLPSEVRLVMEAIIEQFYTIHPKLRLEIFQKVQQPLFNDLLDGYLKWINHIETSFYPISSNLKSQDLNKLILNSNVIDALFHTFQQWSTELYYVEFYEYAEVEDLVFGVWEEVLAQYKHLLQQGIKLLAQEYFQFFIVPMNKYYKRFDELM